MEKNCSLFYIYLILPSPLRPPPSSPLILVPVFICHKILQDDTIPGVRFNVHLKFNYVPTLLYLIKRTCQSLYISFWRNVLKLPSLVYMPCVIKCLVFTKLVYLFIKLTLANCHCHINFSFNRYISNREVPLQFVTSIKNIIPFEFKRYLFMIIFTFVSSIFTAVSFLSFQYLHFTVLHSFFHIYTVYIQLHFALFFKHLKNWYFF